MSYHLYQTKGIVLGNANVGESNRYYHIFTKDLGLVVAFAQGVRELKSKLKYHLQDFNYISLDLIRGGGSWRVTSGKEESGFENGLKDKSKLKIIASITTFLKRFLHGEEKNEPLFDEILSNFSFLSKEELDAKMEKDFEILLVAKILDKLGYWGGNSETKKIIELPTSEETLTMFPQHRSEFLKEVNRAIKESHL